MAGSTAEEVLAVYAPFAMGVIALRLEPRERPVVADCVEKVVRQNFLTILYPDWK